MSVFLVKTNLHPMDFIPSNRSIKVHAWLVYMEYVSDFKVSSHFLESISDIGFI